MEIKDFIQQATRTESLIANDVSCNKVRLKAALQMVVATNNALDLVKKELFYGRKVDELKAEGFLNEMLVAQNVFKESANAVHAPLNADSRLVHAIIGMNTEPGEMAEALLAHLEGAEFDIVNFGEELGDYDWYKAIALDTTGLSETEIRERVIEKLRARYPQRFEAALALNRDLEKERKILEGN